MRQHFHQQLDDLGHDLAAMCTSASVALSKATQALLTADVALAEEVITGDAAIDQQQLDLDDKAVAMLAQQQPVAGDLRLLVSALRMSMTIERMGDLARHVAKIARLRYPNKVSQDAYLKVFDSMGQVGAHMAQQAAELINSRDLGMITMIMTDDDQMDELHRDMFTHTLSQENHLEPATIIDLTLLSRYYERFGDHCVSVAQRVEFLITGEIDRGRTLGG